MFWADEIAEKIIQRSPENEHYRVHDYKTPSGRVHVGALRGVVIHEMIRRALVSRGKEAEFTYGFDDYDPMDGFPVYLPESFRQYMGQPLSEIPSPEEGSASFARCYGEEFVGVINYLGIKPTIWWMKDFYKDGKFDEAIRVTLDKAAIIRDIYKEITGATRRDDWYPLNVICSNCHKIGTTRIYAWDGDQVSYKCEPKMVTWAEGCGHEGKMSPFGGNAKLPWKPEWAAKWFMFREDFETAGKDHMTKNGSFDVAAAICQKVFEAEPPLGREYPYEWLLIGGKKMSSSKGTGASAKQVAELIPAHLLAFLLGKTKPNRHLEFNPDGNTVPLLYDEYDRAIASYNQDPNSDGAKMILYTKPEDQVIPHYTMRFTKVAFLSQMPNIDIWQTAAEEKGAPLSSEDKIELQERLDYAEVWLKDLAPDEMKFELQETLPKLTLTDQQKDFIGRLSNLLETDSWQDGQSVHKIIHDLRSEMELPAKDAFSAIYQLFLKKDSGPQAGWFLAALDKDFVIKRLKEATKEGKL
jgi:lysyl-tRNA synthetase class 1